MTTSWLFENFDASNWEAFTGFTGDISLGTKGVPLQNAVVDALRWYRATTDALHKPSHLALFDELTGDNLYEASPVPDDGTIGWQTQTIDPPIAVDARQGLIAAIAMETYRTIATYSVGTIPPPNIPAGLWIPTRYYGSASPWVIPTSADALFIHGVDFRITTGGGPAEYEVVAETDYDSTLKWEQEADRYLLDVTTIKEWATAKLIEGIDVRRIIGGWQPLSGSYQGKRFPIDSPHFVLELPNQARINGLLLDTSPGSAGHIQALLKV